jgi:hypothetical protein
VVGFKHDYTLTFKKGEWPPAVVKQKEVDRQVGDDEVRGRHIRKVVDGEKKAE